MRQDRRKQGQIGARVAFGRVLPLIEMGEVLAEGGLILHLNDDIGQPGMWHQLKNGCAQRFNGGR